VVVAGSQDGRYLDKIVVDFERRLDAPIAGALAAQEASLTEWRVPPANQPRAQDYEFDLDRTLASIVGLHSIIRPMPSPRKRWVPSAPAMAC